MQCLIPIVWVGAEIANSLYRMCVFVISYILTRGKGAPPPPREDLCGAQSPDHLERMTVRQLVFGDIFDERRAAPPAYGRRAWSKVVSYLMVFWYVFRYWSKFRRRLNNKTVLNYRKLVKTMLGQLRNSLFDFEALACRRCALLENCSLDRLFQMARRARWNNPKCT